MTVARLTPGAIETLSQANPKARVTQTAVEVASQHASGSAKPGNR